MGYAGKPEVGAGPYHIPAIDDVVKDLVTKTHGTCPLEGRNLTMDRRLYGSVPIAQRLLEQRMTSTCTIQLYRRGLPVEVKDGKNRMPLSKTLHYEKVYIILISQFY